MDINNLPQAMLDLIDATDLNTACCLVQAFGGVRVYIPHKLPANHSLVCVLGNARAEQLIKNYGGESLNIPRCAHALRSLRNTKIKQDRDNGLTTSELSLRYGLTERQVYCILAARNDPAKTADSRQGDLFGIE